MWKFGQYVGAAGLGSDIALFYSVQGMVSIFMPALMGIIADRWIPVNRVLGACHLLAAAFMGAAWWYGHNHPQLEFAPFFTLYTLSVAFYMPTIALANSTAFKALKMRGYDTVSAFPPIRTFGTIGFIASMWLVNSVYWHAGGWGFTLSDANPMSAFRFQYTDMQLLTSAVLGLLLGLFAFTLPVSPVDRSAAASGRSVADSLGLSAFRLFADRRMALFFVFSMLLGVALQITNGFATTFITSFKGVEEYASTFGANNATLLTSLSQVSEALCILLIPFCLRRFGIKRVMLIAMLAWVLRFGFFAAGNPGSGVWLFILSMIVYGVASDCHGPSVGTLIAGAVVNRYVSWQTMPDGRSYMLGDWSTPWLIFAAYALVVAVLFAIFFRYSHKPAPDGRQIGEAEDAALEIE